VECRFFKKGEKIMGLVEYLVVLAVGVAVGVVLAKKGVV